MFWLGTNRYLCEETAVTDTPVAGGGSSTAVATPNADPAAPGASADEPTPGTQPPPGKEPEKATEKVAIDPERLKALEASQLRYQRLAGVAGKQSKEIAARKDENTALQAQLEALNKRIEDLQAGSQKPAEKPPDTDQSKRTRDTLSSVLQKDETGTWKFRGREVDPDVAELVLATASLQGAMEEDSGATKSEVAKLRETVDSLLQQRAQEQQEREEAERVRADEENMTHVDEALLSLRDTMLPTEGDDPAQELMDDVFQIVGRHFVLAGGHDAATITGEDLVGVATQVRDLLRPLLGLQVKAQADDNDRHRRANPGTRPASRPTAVSAPKNWRNMTEEERQAWRAQATAAAQALSAKEGSRD